MPVASLNLVPLIEIGGADDGDRGTGADVGLAHGPHGGNVGQGIAAAATVRRLHRAGAAVAARVVGPTAAAGAAGHVTGKVLRSAAVVGVVVLTACIAVARLDVDRRAVAAEDRVAGGAPLEIDVDVAIGSAGTRPGDVLYSARQPARWYLEGKPTDEVVARKTGRRHGRHPTASVAVVDSLCSRTGW